MKRARYIASQVEMGTIFLLCSAGVGLLALEDAGDSWLRRAWFVALLLGVAANLIAQVVRRSIDRRLNIP